MSDGLTVQLKLEPWRRDVQLFWTVGCLVPALLLRLGWPGLVMMLVAQAAVLFHAYRFFQRRLEFDHAGLTIVGVSEKRRVSYDDIIAFTGDYDVRFIGGGVSDYFWVGPGGHYEIADFLHAHAPLIKIDPVEPWVDRYGHWHSELHRTDPLESIRSIRRAAFGRWFMEVKVLDERRFQGIAHTLAGPPGLWAGDEHPTLREATDDAVRMIGELRQQE